MYQKILCHIKEKLPPSCFDRSVEGKRKLFLTAILAAIEIILAVGQLGFFTFGRISITILHIPVFIGTILCGLPQGIFLSIVFGVSSMLTAMFRVEALGLLDSFSKSPSVCIAEDPDTHSHLDFL